MADKSKNVFVSHVHEDDEGLKDLKALVEKHGMSLRDASIDSSKPNEATSSEYIKSEILAPRISWAGVFVVLITPKTKDSEWVDWEIDYAVKEGKRIVGIWGHGDNNCEVPEALDDYADAIVGWNGERIIDALEGRINERDGPDGTACPARPIERYSC
jgi:hypothetical protein